MEHNHEHTHVHSHGGAEHTHVHSHAHDHAHPHTHDHDHVGHDHSHGAVEGGEKTLAVLTYMLDHNIHHCAELKDLASILSGEAQHQLLHAVEDFDTANAHLAKAIEELKK